MALTAKQRRARRAWQRRALGLGYEDGASGGGASGISFVADATDSIPIGTSDTVVNLPGGIAENDMVVVLLASDVAIGTGSFSGGIVTSGYNNIQNDNNASSVGFVLAYKIMGSTPDSTITIDQSSTRAQALLIQVFRSVDTAAPIDAEGTPATGATGLPDPPAVTTTVNNTWVVAVGVLDDDAAAASTTAPIFYTNLTAAEATAAVGSSATAMMASRLVESAGVENPGAFGGSGDDLWWAHTFSLKPA